MALPTPKGKLWWTFDRRLQVYIPPKAFILAHKLVAGRRKDAGDIVALFETLQIRTRKQAQKVLAPSIEKAVQQAHGVQETLDRFFPGEGEWLFKDAQMTDDHQQRAPSQRTVPRQKRPGDDGSL